MPLRPLLSVWNTLSHLLRFRVFLPHYWGALKCLVLQLMTEIMFATPMIIDELGTSPCLPWSPPLE